MGRGNAKRRGALPSWSIPTRSPIEPCQALRALRAQQIFLSWVVGVAHSHESLIDGRREVRGQKVGSCLQSHVSHHLLDGKFSRGAGEKQRFQGVWHIDVVTCLVLVLFVPLFGGINQHMAVAQFVYEEQGYGACVVFAERAVLGRNAINFQSAARKISKMFAARKKNNYFCQC